MNTQLSLSEIKEIVVIKEQIASLEQKLAQIVDGEVLSSGNLGNMPAPVKKKRQGSGRK